MFISEIPHFYFEHILPLIIRIPFLLIHQVCFKSHLGLQSKVIIFLLSKFRKPVRGVGHDERQPLLPVI